MNDEIRKLLEKITVQKVPDISQGIAERLKQQGPIQNFKEGWDNALNVCNDLALQALAQLQERTKDEIYTLIEKYGDPNYKTNEFALYDVIAVAQQLQAQLGKARQTSISCLEDLSKTTKRIVELEAALNMEEAYSQFHPKIPYKWKYEHQLKRTKNAGKYIVKLQAQIAELKGYKEQSELSFVAMNESNVNITGGCTLSDQVKKLINQVAELEEKNRWIYEEPKKAGDYVVCVEWNKATLHTETSYSWERDTFCGAVWHKWNCGNVRVICHKPITLPEERSS